MNARRSLPIALTLVAALAAAASAAPPKTVTREAEGDYVGNNLVPRQLIVNFTDGGQLGAGALIFDILAPKTDKIISLGATDELAANVPMLVKFFNAKGESLDAFTREVCTKLPRMKVPAGTDAVKVEILPTGCGATPATSTGTVLVKFTNR